MTSRVVIGLFIDQPWTVDAACKNKHPDLFFPVATGTPNEAKEVVRRAKLICEACSVRPQCLEYALENEDFGVWGGLSKEERAAIRRDRRADGLIGRKPQPRVRGCGTEAGYRWHLRHNEPACDDCAKANRLSTALRSKREAS